MHRDMMVPCGALFAMMGFQTPAQATDDPGAAFRDAEGKPTAVARSVSDFGHAILKKVAATLAGAWSVLAALDRPTPGFAMTAQSSAWFHPSWTPPPSS